jgi:hypothetical protein
MTDQSPAPADPLSFKLLRDAWAAKAITFDNAREDHVLFQDESRVICLDSSWGPPVPYPPARRPGGFQNHGYVPTKGNPQAIAAIPELQGWPEYEALIAAINNATGPAETVGCEKSFFDCDQGAAKIYLGSYTDVIFSVPLENTAENHLRLASEIGRAMFGARRWWGKVEIGIQRKRVSNRLPDSGWGMMLKIINHGRDADEARKFWGRSAGLLAELFRAKGLPVESPPDASYQPA